MLKMRVWNFLVKCPPVQCPQISGSHLYMLGELMKNNMNIIIIIFFLIVSVFAEKEVLVFQQSLNGYNGVTDTYINQDPKTTHVTHGQDQKLLVQRCPS